MLAHSYSENSHQHANESNWGYYYTPLTPDTLPVLELHPNYQGSDRCAQRGQFTCPKGHLSETYRHRVRVRARVRVRFSVKFRNLHNYISDK